MKYLMLGLVLVCASVYALPTTNDEYRDRKYSSETTGSDVDTNEVRQLDAIGGGGHLLRRMDNVAGERLLRQVRRPGLDSLSGGGFGVSKRMDSLSGKGFGEQKRNFDEIDRSGFNSFAKKNFDEIDRSGFNGFVKKNFDEIDRSGFNGFVKKNFDEIDRSGFNGFVKKNFDEIDRSGFDSFVKRNFDEIDRVGFSNFLKRSIPELLSRYYQSKDAN